MLLYFTLNILHTFAFYSSFMLSQFSTCSLSPNSYTILFKFMNLLIRHESYHSPIFLDRFNPFLPYLIILKTWIRIENWKIRRNFNGIINFKEAHYQKSPSLINLKDILIHERWQILHDFAWNGLYSGDQFESVENQFH